MTLEVLRERRAFDDWRGDVEAEDLRTSRRIVRDLIDELIALGPDGDEVSKLDAFLRAVRRFNGTEFIETVEREDIGELFHQIAEAACAVWMRKSGRPPVSTAFRPGAPISRSFFP